MPLFSIIIPLYNKQEYVGNTLKGIFAQTFTDYEIIIINDGSTDDSEAIVLSLKDSRIVYKKTLNKGVASARNTGIKMAKGNLIAFLDADDDWLPNHLEVLYNLYSNHPDAGIFASRYLFKLPGNKLLKPDFKNIDNKFSGIVPDFFLSSLKYRIATSSSVAVPKTIFESTGYFNESYTNSEDTDMWIRISIKYQVALSNKHTSIYNFYIADSLSKNSFESRRTMDFNQYKEAEKTNNGLKQFLDLYRLEYALKYRVQGIVTLSNALLKEVAPENIGTVQRLLLTLPPAILRILFYIKKSLYNAGIVKV